MIRDLMPAEIVLIEGTQIAELEFLIGGATLLQTMILDLFAGHDAGIDFEQIAFLNSQATASMDLETAEARGFRTIRYRSGRLGRIPERNRGRRDRQCAR